MEKLKAITVRLPKETWRYLREVSTYREQSINAIMIELIEEMKKNNKKIVDKK